MINPASLDISALPSLPLEQRQRLPAISAIYFAIDSLGNVQYIGRSGNLNHRWLNHHTTKPLQATNGIKIAWMSGRCSRIVTRD